MCIRDRVGQKVCYTAPNGKEIKVEILEVKGYGA